MSAQPSQALEVFFSYAHRDEALRDELVKHLSPLQHQGVITAWHDRKITAGTEWAGAIDAHLQSAQIILMLVSADFIASDYCYDVEMQRAMARHEAKEARVIPVILRPVVWQDAPFGKLQALPNGGNPITTWSNQDTAFVNVVHGILTVVQELTGRSIDSPVTSEPAFPLDAPPTPAPLPPGSRMPLARNPLFVGREADLLRLARALRGGGTAAIGPQAAVATGLGGIGKTQLACEFVHRYGQFFAGGVFWLSCAEPEAIAAEVAACGQGLPMPAGFASLSLNEQVQLVQRAWQEPLPRLLVFDNCEAETLLAQWRPPHGGCRVLLTSRRLQWDATLGVHVLPLNVLARPESIALLRQYHPDLAEDDAGLSSIAANLGDLPLALHLAGSFLARYRDAVTPSAYLAQLQQPGWLEHPSLQGWKLTRDTSPTLHEQHVARTFALSYERLDARDTTDALALALLARAACFAPGEPIPRDVLLATLSQDADNPDATLAREDALRRLYGLGLLERAASGAVRLHRLLAAFVQSAHSDPEAQTVVEQTILTTASRLNAAGDPRPLLALEVHLRAVTDAAQRREDTPAAGLCNALGFRLHVVGQYAEARPYYERALAIREQILGPEHPNTATSLNNLGDLLQAQGDLGGARPYLERALAICEQVLGPEHPDTAGSLNNLGTLLQEQGDLGGARPYYERALHIFMARLGPNHASTQTVQRNLAALEALMNQSQ
jgi:tetratricopeptide (TPR) repeat protein